VTSTGAIPALRLASIALVATRLRR
jgi:hypothetical protein